MTDEADAEPELILRGLQNHADLAINVGLFIASYAYMEIMLWKLYSRILGLSEEGTIELLGGIQSFAHKMDAVERFVTRTTADPQIGAYQEIFQRARSINSYRINLVHGIYMERPDGSVWLYGGRTDPTRKKGASVSLTAASINEMTQEVLQIGNDIQSRFFPADQTVTLLRK